MEQSVRAVRPPFWRRPRVIVMVLLLLLVIAIAATTKVVDADGSVVGRGASTFNAVDYATEKYDSAVVPTIERNAMDIAELLATIVQDPESAGERYGHRDGEISPYAYAISGTGVAGEVSGTLLPVRIDGLPDGVEVVIQIGPAINGTALRDATGLISFDQFLNQLEYAAASTELNNHVKAKVLANVDAAGLAGEKITFVGAFAYGSNPKLIQVTPVHLKVAS